MNILILSQYYHPEPIPKPHELAESLQQRGHNVTVITGCPNYPTGKVYSGYRIRPWQTEWINGVRVVRLALFPDHSRSTVRRILNYGSFMLSASLLGPWKAGKTDVIYVWQPPLTIGVSAWVVGTLRRAPVLCAVHDIWPESAIETGMLGDGFIVRGLRRLERFVYARASAIGVASPGFVDDLVGKGVPREKIHVLRDWADDATYRPAVPDRKLALRLGMVGKFNVVFGGGLGLAQGLDVVIAAADLVRDHDDVQIIFAGDGVAGPRLKELVRERGLPNVRFLGRMSPDDIRRVYALSDVLLAHLRAGFFSTMSIPGKTYAYLASGKPVLMAMDGAAAKIIRDAQAGVTCPPEDPRAMADAILALKNISDAEREAMGAAGRRAFLEHYDRVNGVGQHETILMGLVGEIDP